jgi:beta-glucosidase
MAATATAAIPDYHDASLPLETRVEALLSRMTLAEKVGQMTQVEKNSIEPAALRDYFIGSVLSGGGGSPRTNTAAGWAAMTTAYQQAALQTRLGIPMLYGADAVHGHGNLSGATLFPHNIGLGATRDANLVERIGAATAAEMLPTGVVWNFAPMVAVAQDIRWGRTYESFAEQPNLVAELGAAYLRGLQGYAGGQALATAKHFIGDGGTAWMSSTASAGRPYLIDQGDVRMPAAQVRALFLEPYRAAIAAGAQCIMVSFSSVNGIKMHASHALLTDLLKGELGFNGFLVSDWEAIDQLTGDYHSDVVAAINAGIDMVMVPTRYQLFIKELLKAAEAGEVHSARIDDAVRRILRVKLALGLFENPLPAIGNAAIIRSAAHLELARAAVRQSLVLLKNDNAALPLAHNTPVIFVAGKAADNLGMQSGGWTLEWQGMDGNGIPGTTILDGIRAAAGSAAQVDFNRNGKFDNRLDANGQLLVADAAIVVLGEAPYAEGLGDSATLSLPESDVLERVRSRARKIIVVVISGRPLVLTAQLGQMDALVAAWLPGSEGAGIADVLFGDFPFTGKLPFSWPRSVAQLPFAAGASTGCAAPLFAFGYGLTTADHTAVALPDCP